ncbi:MAG TPA: CBS domain-containing protein [Polyangia bacterium]
MTEPVTKILEQKSEPLETVSPRASISEAIARMNEKNIGSVLVMDGERMVGIFTERDVLTRVVPRGLDPAKMPVTEVMTQRPITIGPNTTVEEAMMVVSDTRRRHLPVIDGGRVIGMISIGDLNRWVVRDQKRTIDDLIDYVHRS